MKDIISPGLKVWFKIHFFIDILFAIPLMIAPVLTLQLFGFTQITPLLARLVAAVLVSIGVTSLFTKTKEQFEIILTLKIIWSVMAIIGLLWSLAEEAPASMWVIVMVFILFSGVWMHYRWKN